VQLLINCPLKIRRCWLTDLWKTRDDHLSSLAITQMENEVESGLLLNVIVRKRAAIHQSRSLQSQFTPGSLSFTPSPPSFIPSLLPVPCLSFLVHSQFTVFHSQFTPSPPSFISSSLPVHHLSFPVHSWFTVFHSRFTPSSPSFIPGSLLVHRLLCPVHCLLPSFTIFHFLFTIIFHLCPLLFYDSHFQNLPSSLWVHSCTLCVFTLRGWIDQDIYYGLIWAQCLFCHVIISYICKHGSSDICRVADYCN
jgi:hypothetical protein